MATTVTVLVRTKSKSDNDGSVKECYSNFTRRDSVLLTHKDVHHEAYVLCLDNINLIYPGDVVEFRDTMVNSAIKIDSTVGIENSNISMYIVLKSGDILHQTKHAILKPNNKSTRAVVLRLQVFCAKWFTEFQTTL